MSKSDEIKQQINSLTNKSWNSPDEEKRARLHELIMLYDKILELGDENEDVYFIYEPKARIHAHLKETEKAEACIRKLLELVPGNTTALWLLTEVQFDSQQYTEALISIDQCIAGTFGADFRYDFRAKINRALGNLEEAEKDQKIYDDYQAREQAKWDDPNHYYHYK